MIYSASKTGDGFGNQSYLMLHLLTLATCWFYFLQKQRFFLSQYIYKLKLRSLYEGGPIST